MAKHLCIRAFLFVTLALLVPSFRSLAQERALPWDFPPKVQQALDSNLDLLGQEVLARGEPSFEGVAKYFPEMKRPRAIVGVKEHPEFVGVAWDGTLSVGSYAFFFHLGTPPSPYGIQGPVAHSLLDGYLPVLQTKWEYDGLQYEETVLGYSRNLSTDEPLAAYVRIRVTNPRGVEAPVRVTVRTAPALGGELPSSSVSVPAGASHDFYFRIPYKVDPQRPAVLLEASEFNRAVDETRTFWKNLLNQYMQIQTPETRVNDAYRAWLMYNFLNVKKVGDTFEIYDGRPFYEQIYGYSAALYCDALAQYGYGKDAEAYLESLLSKQRLDGAYITPDFGMPDNGALLFALARQYELSHDLAWFKTVAHRMVKSCDWISRSRSGTKLMQNEVRALTYGLLPPAQSYCDYRAPVVSYFSDAYNWLGMQEAAKAFQEAGMSGEGDKWMREAADYRNDILHSMERALVDVGGFKALPVEPLTQRLLKEGGGDYYGLIAPEILETDLFGPDDPRSSWITRYMDERGGLMLGLDRFADGVDHAYTYGYAMTQLRAGNVDKFLLTFYGMLAYGMARGTYSSVEATRAPYGFNELTLPHTYSGTQQLRMLRMMLVREEGNNLWLAFGTPRAWLEDGKSISVAKAPTAYGLLSYTLAASSAKAEAKASIQPLSAPGGHYPGQVKLRLRVPVSLGKLKNVTVNGKEWRSFTDDQVLLDGSMLKEALEVVARY